jgi:hypothetical protein
MKKSDLNNIIRENLRTRFMFEKEGTPEEPTSLTEPTQSSPTPEEETPHDKALKMGLVDKKFGRYADPNSNKIVAKIIDGQLTKVEPQDAEEDIQAQEPSLSGFNYKDPYGDDYPKPKNQLGAVPPEFKPLKPMTPIDSDVYANPSKLVSPSGRTSRYGIGDITGNKSDNDTSISIASNWSNADKKSASTGGVGTYKGGEQQGTLTHSDSDNDSAKEQGRMVAAGMIKKFGQQTALSKAQNQLNIEEEKFKQLSSHNSNVTPDRLKKLEKIQFTIDRLRHAITTLQGSIVESLIVEISDAGVEAKQLGLIHKGWGRYFDKSGKMVARSINGKLVKVDSKTDQPSKKLNKSKNTEIPNQSTNSEVTPDQPDIQIDKEAIGYLIKEKGMTLIGRKPSIDNEPRIHPGWNKKLLHAEVEFDANADETVARLMEMFKGDSVRLMKWLVKKFKEATPAGKQRLKQYMLIVMKDMKQNGGATEPERKRDPAIDGLLAM